MAKKKEYQKIMTPEFRASFPELFEPKAFGQQKPKYGITMLFDKTADLSEMKKAAMKAAVAEFGPKESWPEGFKWPFRNGDKKKDRDGYAGMIFIKASTSDRPAVFDRLGKPITPESKKFYAGCYAQASIVCAAFNKDGGTGVTFYLNGVKKTRDGEPFSARGDVSKDFTFDADDGGDDEPQESDMGSDDGDFDLD